MLLLTTYVAKQQLYKNQCSLLYIRSTKSMINQYQTHTLNVSKQVFFSGTAHQKSQSAVFMLPKKGVSSAVIRTVQEVC